MPVPETAEAKRILEEYARRSRELPPDYYSRERPENLFRRHSQERAVRRILSKQRLFPLADKRILEVGCGNGDWLSLFAGLGADQGRLAGIDLDAQRLTLARERLPRADLRLGDASQLPWPDGAFDLVTQSTAFSSMLDPAMRSSVAGEMARVAAPGGAVLWYDFFVDNPANPHVVGLGREDVRRLFPGFAGKFLRITLAPPLSRLIVPRWWTLGSALEQMRLLNTHYLVILRRVSG